MGLPGGGDGGGDGVFVRDVAGVDGGAAAEGADLGGDCLAGGCVASGEGHVGPGGGEFERDGAAHALGGAGE